ncbi:MAG TPA: ChaN family lipoprotein, partial [Gemmatimonadales bacterium]|nr:ChaN family lipoprotein [Gemmatimonadales bacterium]
APLEPWLDEHGFDRKAWRWPVHQPVVDAAISSGRSLWGSGLSRDELRAVVRGGESAAPASLQQLLNAAPLDSAGRASIDQELVEGHCGKLPAAMIPGMRAAQTTRDAAMTHAMMLASPGGPVWLIAGNGHVRRDQGVPRLLAKAAPGKKILVVGLVEREADGSAPSAESRKPYDLVLITPRAEREDPCAGL